MEVEPEARARANMSLLAGNLASPNRLVGHLKHNQHPVAIAQQSQTAGHRNDALLATWPPRSGERPALPDVGAQHPNESAPARMLPRADDGDLPSWRPGIWRQRKLGH
jgi:hypothetical protein